MCREVLEREFHALPEKKRRKNQHPEQKSNKHHGGNRHIFGQLNKQNHEGIGKRGQNPEQKSYMLSFFIHVLKPQ